MLDKQIIKNLKKKYHILIKNDELLLKNNSSTFLIFFVLFISLFCSFTILSSETMYQKDTNSAYYIIKPNYYETENEKIYYNPDTSIINLYLPSKTHLDSLKNNLEFGKDIPDERNNLMEFLYYLRNKILNLLGNIGETDAGKVIFGIIILVILIFVTYVALKNRSIFLLKNTDSSILSGLTIIEEIKNLDFDNEIKSAILQKDYRKAVRLHYLSSIKKLSEKGIIALNYSKTNIDYLNEIGKNEIKREFKELTRIFNFIFYGNFNITEKNYVKIEPSFIKFYGMINID